MDSRIQRLLFVASSLGLCHADDADLIRGSCSRSKQVGFMSMLLDVVYIMDKSEDPHARSIKSPGMVSEGSSLEEQFESACTFVDTLAETEKIDLVLTSEVKLLPPDITHLLEIKAKEDKQSDDKKSGLPDIGKLEERAVSLEDDLRRQEEILGELTKAHEYPEDDAQSIDKVQRTLRLVLSELTQLVIGFSYCFENELRQWCNKSPPERSELGPTFKRVYSLLTCLVQFLSDIGTIRNSHKTLCSSMPEKVRTIAETSTWTKVSKLPKMIEDFEECISILEDSLHRTERTNASTSSFRSLTTAGLLK